MEQEGDNPKDQRPPRQPKSFLSLPVEVRIKTYDLVLFHPLGFTPEESLKRQGRDPNTLALLYVNKTIAAEAAGRFYSINKFCVTSLSWDVVTSDGSSEISFATWLKNIGNNAQHIRSLLFRHYYDRPDEMYPYAKRVVDMNIRPLVPSLRSICLAFCDIGDYPFSVMSNIGYDSSLRGAREIIGGEFRGVEKVDVIVPE